MRRVQLVVFALSLMVLLAAGGASAQPTWLAPQDLSPPGQDALSPQIALDPAGDAVAVWSSFSADRHAVQAAERRAGGKWSPSHDISSAGKNAYDPQVALDASGNAVAVWVHWSGANDVIQASERPAGGSWGAPQDVSAVGDGTLDPDVAVDGHGDAVAVWTRSNGENFIVQAAVRPAGGSWGAPENLSAPGADALGPEVALDRAGNAVVVWTRSNIAEGLEIIQAEERPAGGRWGAPENLSAPGANATGPEVALDRAGNALAIWLCCYGTVQAASQPAGGSWGKPQDVSSQREAADDPRLALGPGGDAVAVWWNFNGTNSVVRAASRLSADTWGTPQDLSVSGEDSYDPRAAVGPAGNAVAVWFASNASEEVVKAAARPAGGRWSAPRELSLPTTGGAREPQVALGPAGNAVAVWWRSNGTNDIVQASIAAPCAVPKLVGKAFNSARRLIKSNGCRAGKIARAFSKKAPRGHVLRQRPRAGARLAYPAAVTLVISRGKRR